MPNKRGVLIRMGSEKIMKFNKSSGVKINGGSEFEKCLTMIRKLQSGCRKAEAKIHREARYFVLKLGLNSTNKERCNEEFVRNFIFLKIYTRRVGKKSKYY